MKTVFVWCVRIVGVMALVLAGGGTAGAEDVTASVGWGAGAIPAAVGAAPTLAASAIAAGSHHTCALTTGGGVKCWGDNGYGQLGDGTQTQRLTAVDVSGLTIGVSAIAAGYDHTCALTTGGGVKCWGDNGYGQLGDGTQTQRLTAVDVSGLTSGVSAVAARGFHTCALTSGGGVKCWGYNVFGQLGDGTTTDRSNPVDVVGLSSGVGAIAAGYHHTCALTTGGGVKCWGYNVYGQLGDGTTTDRSNPVDVVGLSSGVGAIAAGEVYTCALTTGGGPKCWGANYLGQLGDWTTTPRLTPVAVFGLTSGVSAVAAGGDNTCALTTGGGVKCWGYNDLGQVGDGTTTWRLTPVAVVGLTNGVSAIAAAGAHTCALTTGGGVKCWGDNGYGQLGDGTQTNRLTPVDVVGFTGGVSGCYALLTASAPANSGAVARALVSGNTCNNGADYTSGSVVRLTANAADGYKWSSWSGVSGPSSVVNVIMDGNKTVTANFASKSQPPKPVVVLVHGWWGLKFPGFKIHKDSCKDAEHAKDINNIPTNDFGVFAKNLMDAGWDVWVAHVATGPDGTPIIEDNADCLKKQLSNIQAATPVTSVVLIAHSMGGLVSRAYIESPVNGYYLHNVSRLITLGTPHDGTPLGIAPCASNQKDDAACQFSTTGIDYFISSYPRANSSVLYDFIGGTASPGTFGDLLKKSAQGPNDGVVGAESSLGRQYRFPFSPAVVVQGSNITRYMVGASHLIPPTPIPDPLWWPSYFYQSSIDQTSLTDTYRCMVGPLLGINGGVCPSHSAVPNKAPSSVTVVASETPRLSGHLESSQIMTSTVPIDSSDLSQFTLTWITGTLGFTLTNPLGMIIDPVYAAAHPATVNYTANVTDSTSLLFSTYTISPSLPGVYTLTITANTVLSGGTDYSASAVVYSTRVLTVATNSNLYAIGSPALIMASLQNAGIGLTGATVQAQLSKPGVVTDTVLLTDSGGGFYTAVYTIPNVPGYLGLSVVAQGNDAGMLYARQTDTLLAVSPSTIQVADRYRDAAVDGDGNGKAESLDVGIVLTATKAGSYLVSGDLMGAGNVYVAHGVVSTTLDMGVVTATLSFNGDEIRGSRMNGSYTLTNLTISDQQNAGVPAVWQAQNVYATAPYNWSDFAASCYVLTAKAQGTGSVVANPGPNCNGGLQYAAGTTVTLTATMTLPYQFIGWSGDVSGNTNPTVVSADADREVWAAFVAPNNLYLPIIVR
jgi:alpha-tubulin suppressor-like RCC1 family protein/pimeloyl-ACP methyl ester carboxylesterase